MWSHAETLQKRYERQLLQEIAAHSEYDLTHAIFLVVYLQIGIVQAIALFEACQVNVVGTRFQSLCR